jgi:catechol 2,3-dioxygenase-like lactoylglutathione lyase family enzyme
MDFASVRLITDNLDSMVEFYEGVTQVTADRLAPVFAELRFSSCTLALGHTSTAALFNNAARPAQNQTAILEWVVDDVDAEYDRLRPIVSEWEQEPTLMPWGNRSILFRDPDGNLVNLFTPVTDDAIN